MTEADESATSKETALANLLDQVRKRETMGVIYMYERAAWQAGATHEETDAILRKRSEENAEGLTWPEWAAAAGCAPFGEGILRDEWRAGVDPTEYRANPGRRDLLAGVIARQDTRAEAEDWLFNNVHPKTGYKVVCINGLWCVVKPR